MPPDTIINQEMVNTQNDAVFPFRTFVPALAPRQIFKLSIHGYLDVF